MSACISAAGEYGEHQYPADKNAMTSAADEFTCEDDGSGA